MNITLPRPLKQWVDQQVEQKGYGTANEFIQHVLNQRKAMERAHGVVEAGLLAAIDSGPATPMTSRDWASIKREGLKRLRAARG